MFPEITAEIIAENLSHNLQALRGCCRDGVHVCAPLKADAYGHGLDLVAGVLEREGVSCAAVAQLDEAIRLRELGWSRMILVLGNALGIADTIERRERLAAAIEHGLMLTVTDDRWIPEIERVAAVMKQPLSVHVKIDTGMGRVGCSADDGVELVQRMYASEAIRLAGIYSQFACADEEDHALVDQQLSAFTAIHELLSPHLGSDCLWHMANTAATIAVPQSHFDMVRPGLGLFGYAPNDRLAAKLSLKPCMRVSSHVAVVRQLPAGHCVGYGCTFKTRRPTRLGIVPIGYHDGYLRALSNQAVMGTAAGDAPVIGRVSMDQTAIDLTDLPSVGEGAAVVVIDERRERPNSVESLSKIIGTIPYEVSCLLGPRVERRLAASADSVSSAA